MLQDSVDRQSCTIRLEHSEIQRLHCILKDLSSLTQTLARLSTLFTDQGKRIINIILNFYSISF